MEVLSFILLFRCNHWKALLGCIDMAKIRNTQRASIRKCEGKSSFVRTSLKDGDIMNVLNYYNCQSL
jgi:hypothetical protein